MESKSKLYKRKFIIIINMEIINLFFLTIMVYILSGLEFYVKMLMFFAVSMFVSLLLNHKFIQEKVKDSNELKYIIGNKIIIFTFSSYDKSIYYIDEFIKLPIICDIYHFLEKVNNQYVLGRNKVVASFGSFLYNIFLPKFEISSLLSPPAIQNEKKTEMKKISNTFKSESDMNEFLNELLKKDK